MKIMMQEIHPMKDRELYEVFPIFASCCGQPMTEEQLQKNLEQQMKERMKE